MVSLPGKRTSGSVSTLTELLMKSTFENASDSETMHGQMILVLYLLQKNQGLPGNFVSTQ